MDSLPWIKYPKSVYFDAIYIFKLGTFNFGISNLSSSKILKIEVQVNLKNTYPKLKYLDSSDKGFQKLKCAIGIFYVLKTGHIKNKTII